MEIIENYGILTSMSWNSNKWGNNPTKDDLKASKYDYVKENAHMHESINFGHEKYPLESDGSYIAYTPMFRKTPNAIKSKNVEIIFLLSSDYRNSNKKNIIGLYGFPSFGEWFEREANHKLYEKYDGGNIKSFPENIVYFNNPVVINNLNARRLNLLPKGKKISQQGFNYLNSDNVFNLIGMALQLNPSDKKLNSFLSKLPNEIEYVNLKNDIEYEYKLLTGETADTTEGIKKIEKKMKLLKPKLKERLSSYIERGSIATKVKKMTNYSCLICEALGLSTYSFVKQSGDRYVEAHHVEPVSTLKVGTLSLTNLITVCANHHRQLHFGNSKLLRQTDRIFEFEIDNKKVTINKIKVK